MQMSFKGKIYYHFLGTLIVFLIPILAMTVIVMNKKNQFINIVSIKSFIHLTLVIIIFLIELFFLKTWLQWHKKLYAQSYKFFEHIALYLITNLLIYFALLILIMAQFNIPIGKG